MKVPYTITLSCIIILSCQLAKAQNVKVMEETYFHKPVIKMKLNNKDIWVLLDTGSDITILNINSKDKYEFGTFMIDDPKYKVPGFGSDYNQLHHVSKAELKFGDTVLKQNMYAFNITNIARNIEARTGKRITAIIGTDMMRKYNFVIDIGNNTVAMFSKIEKSRRPKNKSNTIMSSSEIVAKGSQR